LWTGEHQASALERLLGARRRATAHPSTATADPRVLVVASGKGGVGKTNLSVNLAVALQQRRHRVLLIDADIGLGDVETLCGLRCARGRGGLRAGRGDLSDSVEVGPAGIWCVAGGAALHEAAGLEGRHLHRLVQELLSLDLRPTHVLADLP